MNDGATQQAAAGAASARQGDRDEGTVNPRWKAQSTAQPMSAAFRSILLTDKRRRSNEHAVKDMNATLLQETLDGLRQKAHDLQNDKWMYEDVHM